MRVEYKRETEKSEEKEKGIDRDRRDQKKTRQYNTVQYITLLYIT